MGHFIRALVYRPSSLGGRTKIYSEETRVSLEQGLELLLMRDDLLDQLETTHSGLPTNLGDAKLDLPNLDTTFAALACELSAFSKIAYVETDFFGGIGRQSAVLWDEGLIVFGPKTESSNSRSGPPTPESLAASPINSVLRQLGARKKGQIDEFAGVGLNRIRSMDG